jgi:hypothetical protein
MHTAIYMGRMWEALWKIPGGMGIPELSGPYYYHYLYY